MKQSIREEELVQLIQSHQKEGFDLLYSNYSQTFYTLILQTVKDQAIAEDIMQEVFVKIWRNIHKYDPAKARLYTWMIRIVRNSCIDYLRSSDHKKQSLQEKIDTVSGLPTDNREVDHGLIAVVSKMEPKYRDVIYSLFYHNYSHSEAAEVLGLPLGTLKSRVRTALLMLKNSLQLSVYE